MRREKSLRIGVHHAIAVVWGPVYRTHLFPAEDEQSLVASRAARDVVDDDERRRLALDRSDVLALGALQPGRLAGWDGHDGDVVAAVRVDLQAGVVLLF